MTIENVTDELVGDFFGFLRHSVVLIPERMWNQVDGGKCHATCKSSTSSRVENRTDGKVCWLEPVEESDKTAKFPMSWCPYVQDSLVKTMLGDDAEHAFTATMDGCSASLGSATDTGAQLFAHVNAAQIKSDWVSVSEKEGAERQMSSQHAQLMYKADASVILHPAHYRQGMTGPKAWKSTTFCVHKIGKPWQLWSQSYRNVSSGVYAHGGVKQARGMSLN